MNIEELSDRELDALVAEKVMGWETTPGADWWHNDCKHRWFPSTDIAAAWMVVEKCVSINGVPCMVTIVRYAHGQQSFECSIQTHMVGRRLGERCWWATHTNPARAICLAALKAVGVKA